MSGRVNVTLGDGRRVTGYRKTLIERKRAPLHLRSDWLLQFHIPDLPGLGIMPYPGVSGVEVCPSGDVECRGKDHAWLLGQAEEFLRRIAPLGIPRPIEGKFGQAGRRQQDVSIDFNGRSGSLVQGTAMRPMSTRTDGERRKA